MDLKKVITDTSMAVAVIACLAVGLFVVFETGLAVFTLAGIGIIFALGVLVGVFISARLFIACTKMDD